MHQSGEPAHADWHPLVLRMPVVDFQSFDVLSGMVLLALSFVAVLLAATPAFADDLPSRGPGLWEQKTVGADVISTIRQCVGLGGDPLAIPAGVCSKREVTKGSDGVRLETVCAAGGAEKRSSTLIIGDFSSNLRLQTVETVTGPGERRVERRVAVDARRLGDCEPGQAPGDLILPNGRVIRAPGAR